MNYLFDSGPAPRRRMSPVLVGAAALLSWTIHAAGMDAQADRVEEATLTASAPDPTTRATTLTWTSQAETATLVVSQDGGPERLFASGPSGSATIDWIRPDSVYTFRLYAEPPRRLVAELKIPAERGPAAVPARSAGLLLFLLALAALAVLVIVRASRKPSGTRSLPQPVRPSSVSAYLASRPQPGPLTLLLLATALYTFATRAEAASVFVMLTGVALLVLVRAPRAAVYGLAVAAFLIHASAVVFHVSNGGHDLESDRDEAVELAAVALLSSRNAWSGPTSLGSPITSGPASVLAAAPVVALTGRINALAFLFWAIMIGLCALGDVRRRNDALPAITLVMLLGLFGIDHTMYWSLEELYFGIPLLAAAWILLTRGAATAAGSLLGLALLVRLSYAFPVAGLLWWYVKSPLATQRAVWRLGLGILTGIAVGLAPFLVPGGGREFLSANPFDTAGGYLRTPWPETNPLFRLLNATLPAEHPLLLAGVKTAWGLSLVALAGIALRKRSISHPFWHVAAGGFAASALVVWPDWTDDYILMFVLPLLLGWAWSRPRAAGDV